MSNRKAIGILGGTFDPIHTGHLRVAIDVKEALNLSEMRLVPCKQPPHRLLPQASAEQRLAMLRLALAGTAHLQLDDCEYKRQGPSYSVDTLVTLKQEFPRIPLVLVIGADAFTALPTWYRWRELMDLAHIAVITRPGWKMDLTPAMADFVEPRISGSVEGLFSEASGNIYCQQVTQLAISATAIREKVGQGESVDFLTPASVCRYIEEQKIYLNEND